MESEYFMRHGIDDDSPSSSPRKSLTPKEEPFHDVRLYVGETEPLKDEKISLLLWDDAAMVVNIAMRAVELKFISEWWFHVWLRKWIQGKFGSKTAPVNFRATHFNGKAKMMIDL